MTQVWPSDIPFCRVGSRFDQERIPNSIDEQSKTGVNESRVIATRSLRKWSNLSIPALTGAQVAAFERWWEIDASFGTEEFTVAGDRGALPNVTFKLIGGQFKISKTGPDRYTLSFGLEER